MRVSPTILAKSEGPFPGTVMASEACVEPTKTMMMPITREQPHAASARISLYTGMGSGGRLCTSPSFHNIADPSRLSVSTASSPSRFAIRIRGLWAKAITVRGHDVAPTTLRLARETSQRQRTRQHTPGHTHTDVARIFLSCAAHGGPWACAAQGFLSRASLVETVGSGRNRDEGGGGKRAWQAAARELDYAFLRFLWDENG